MDAEVLAGRVAVRPEQKTAATSTLAPSGHSQLRAGNGRLVWRQVVRTLTGPYTSM